MTAEATPVAPTPIALVMAARRPGGDPLAAGRGATHKALLEVGSRTMLGHVLTAIEGAGLARRVWISIDEPEVVACVPEVVALRAAGRLELLPSAATPSASVALALERLGPAEELLVFTADHPLLTPEMLRYFAGAAAASSAALVVGVVERETMIEKFPEVPRTFLTLRGSRITGANMFALSGVAARPAVLFWARAEERRKSPLRLAALFGWGTLARFVLRNLDLEQAMERASRVMGVQVAAVRMPFPECALDVDRAEHLAVVEQLLGSEVPPGKS